MNAPTSKRCLPRLPFVPIWLRTGWAVLAFCLIVSLLAGRVVSHFPDPHDRSIDDWGLMDFLDGTYYPAVALLDGINPYDSPPYRANYPVQGDFSPYSPAAVVLHLPFALMPLKAASTVFFVFNVLLLLLLACTILAACSVSLRTWTVFGLAAAVLLTRPGHLVLLGGQIVYEVTIGTVIALHFARLNPWLAGCGLALASLKPTFGVPLAVLMVFRRDFRAAAIGAAMAVAGAGIGTLVIAANTGGLPSFIRVFREQYLQSTGVPGVPEPMAPMRLDAVSVLARLTGMTPGLALELIVFIVVIAVSGVAIWRLADRAPHDGAAGLTAAIIGLAMMACVYHMLYDATLLVLSFAAIMLPRFSSWADAPTPGRATIAAALGVVLFNYLFTNTATRAFGLSGALQVGVVAGHGIAIVVALAMCLYLAVRRSSTTNGQCG